MYYQVPHVATNSPPKNCPSASLALRHNHSRNYVDLVGRVAAHQLEGCQHRSHTVSYSHTYEGGPCPQGSPYWEVLPDYIVVVVPKGTAAALVGSHVTARTHRKDAQNSERWDEQDSHYILHSHSFPEDYSCELEAAGQAVYYAGSANESRNDTVLRRRCTRELDILVVERIYFLSRLCAGAGPNDHYDHSCYDYQYNSDSKMMIPLLMILFLSCRSFLLRVARRSNDH